MKHFFNDRKNSSRSVKRLLDSGFFAGVPGVGSVAEYRTTWPVSDTVSYKVSKIEAAIVEINTSSYFKSRLTY